FVFGHFADRRGWYKRLIIATFFISIAAVIPLALFVHPAASVITIALLAFAFRSTTPLLDALTTITIGTGGNYGRIRAAGSASYIVLVLVLQWIPVMKPDRAFNIAFWIALTSALSIAPAFLLPAARGTARQPKSAGKKPRRIWTAPFIMGFLMIFLSRLGITPVYSFFSLFLVEEMNWNAVGALNALAAASEVPCMFVSGRLIRRFGPLPLLAAAAAGIALRMAVYAFLPFRGAIIAAQCLHSLCFGIFHPAAVAFITSSVPPEQRALGMSLYLSLGTGLPMLLGNLLGGFMLENAGYPALFAVFIVFALAALGIYAVIRKK
ncbi:MAG: MFS transporter, partial [Treponema sp.]|nr:MFS transporter [Treponema sp.]